MLLLSNAKPAFVVVPLGAVGALIRVRPATSLDVSLARARIVEYVAGLRAGSEAVEVIVKRLGPDFVDDAPLDEAKIDAIAERMAEIELLMLCNDGWEGIGAEDGTPLPAPGYLSIAMLLRDTPSRARIVGVLQASIHKERKEGNASAASPPGGAAAGGTSAQAASTSASPAPSGSAETMERAAPSENLPP